MPGGISVEVAAMVYQGTVQNGVVVFPNGVHLPEGVSVRVELVKQEAANEARSPKDDILFRMGDDAVETGISDLAVNINHYLHGHPQAINDK
jgi:hypothetical protein